MSRTVGSSGPRTSEAILKAGLELIYEHGYEAVSLRQLAQAVGIQSGSLYNHIQSKQQLLLRLVIDHLTDLIEAADEALRGIDDPQAALTAFIIFHLRYHLSRKREIYIANSELRSLEPENRRRAVDLRRRYESRLIKILEDMAAEGRIRLPEPRPTAYAVLAMLTGAANWYRPDGRLSEPELIRLHVELVFGGLGAWSSEQGASTPAPPTRLVLGD